MNVELVYFEGCPHADTAYEQLTDATAGRPDIRLTRRLVATPDEAERHQLHGSPTILIDGLDPFAEPDAPATWACRIYDTETGRAGSPSPTMIRDAIASHHPA